MAYKNRNEVFVQWVCGKCEKVVHRWPKMVYDGDEELTLRERAIAWRVRMVPEGWSVALHGGHLSDDPAGCEARCPECSWDREEEP